MVSLVREVAEPALMEVKSYVVYDRPAPKA